MSDIDKNYRVLDMWNCDEVKFSYFWKGDIDDPDERYVGVPSQPEVDEVKNKLIEQGQKDPIVVPLQVRKITVFAWIDIPAVHNPPPKPAERKADAFTSISESSTVRNEVENKKKVLGATLHAISHAFDSFEPLRKIVQERKLNEVSDELMNQIEEASGLYGEEKDGLIQEIDYLESKEDLKTSLEKIDRIVATIQRFLQEIIPAAPYKIPAPLGASDRVSELERKVASLEAECERLRGLLSSNPETIAVDPRTADLEKERDALKKTVEELQDKLRILEERVGVPRPIPDPDVIDRTYVFKHPEGIDDDHIYLMRDLDNYPYVFFYLEKEYLDKQKGLDLKKDITCLIKTIEKHCSSESEKELTAKYRVRLGEDFYLCTGVLSQ